MNSKLKNDSTINHSSEMNPYKLLSLSLLNMRFGVFNNLDDNTKFSERIKKLREAYEILETINFDNELFEFLESGDPRVPEINNSTSRLQGGCMPFDRKMARKGLNKHDKSRHGILSKKQGKLLKKIIHCNKNEDCKLPSKFKSENPKLSVKLYNSVKKPWK